ncbi:MAG: hypothetical protein ABR878_14820 [Roseiarcus sp.]|jgi:hypothetical protein
MRVLAVMVAVLLASLNAEASSLDAVESKLFTLRDFKLDSGVTLPEVTIAYETYGELDGAARRLPIGGQSRRSEQAGHLAHVAP